MATVTNWIDHLNKPADQVAGAVYPGAGSSEGLLAVSYTHLTLPTKRIV